MRKLALLLLVFPADLAAQSMQTIVPRQCVWHAGDNLAWAAPNFDDSAWQAYTQWKPNADQPRIWVRCHANLVALRSLDHPAFQVHLLAASQVFVNGALAGSSGNLSSAQYSMGGFYTVPVRPASLTPASTLALRIAFRTMGQNVPAEILLGDREVLADHRAAAALSGALGYLPVGLCFALIGVVGFMLLGLYVTDRSSAAARYGLPKRRAFAGILLPRLLIPVSCCLPPLECSLEPPGLSTWLASLIARKRKQVATVALANKMARMVWAVLFKGEAYEAVTKQL